MVTYLDQKYIVLIFRNQGDYYLQTNAQYPYGKGRDGIKYIAPKEATEDS